MKPFNEYRWQDHVVRPGWWKLDLLLAAVSICVVSAPFEAERGSDRVLASSESPRSAPCNTGETEPGAEIADPSEEDAPPNGNCAQHGDVGWGAPSM
jgi:hypothetical protein